MQGFEVTEKRRKQRRNPLIHKTYVLRSNEPTATFRAFDTQCFA
jgi:hypothetical protein